MKKIEKTEEKTGNNLFFSVKNTSVRSVSIFFLLVYMLLGLNVYCMACSVPRNYLANDPGKLVMAAKLIIWAQAINMNEVEPFDHATVPVQYKFEIIEVLKGSTSSKEIVIKGDGEINSLWDTTFSEHTEASFKDHYHGRQGNIGDCLTTPPPVFKLGKNYLLFIGGIDDSKNYERVDTKKDWWYLKVKSLLNNEIMDDEMDASF